MRLAVAGILVASLIAVFPVPTASACTIDLSEPRNPQYSDGCTDPDHWLQNEKKTRVGVGTGGVLEKTTDAVYDSPACNQSGECGTVQRNLSTSAHTQLKQSDSPDAEAYANVTGDGLLDSEVLVNHGSDLVDADAELESLLDASVQAGSEDEIVHAEANVTQLGLFEATIPR